MRHFKYFALILSIILLSSNPAYSKTDGPGILLEANPDGLAFNNYTGIAVAANEKSSSVSIVDLATQEVLASIPVGKAPRGVAIDTEINVAVVGSSHENIITVIDLNTYEILADIPVGTAPEGIAVDEVTHTVFVANHKENTVSVIDLQTLTNLGEIVVGHEPIDVAVDSELGYALVVNEKDWAVSVIDLETFEVTGSVPTGKKPQAIDINPDTHLAVVTNEKDNSISIIDLSNWQVTDVPIGKHPIDVAVNELDNTAIVISDEDRLLLVVDLDSGTITRSYELNKLPKGVAVDPYTNVAGVVDDKTDSLTFFQLPSPMPHIEYVEPSPLIRGSYNVSLTIKGSRFMETVTVSIESDTNEYAPEPTLIDFHTLEIGIPAEMLESTGMYELTVTNPEPEGGFDSVELAVINPRPQISFFDPAEVVAGAPGLNLEVFGDGFFGDTKFYVDGAERNFNYIKQSKVELDFNAAELEVGGEREITAYNSPPGGGTSDAVIFTILNPVPVLTSISPGDAVINTPVTLTLIGEGFVKTSQVLFDGQQHSFTYTDGNTLHIDISPIAITGDYPVQVINPAPGGGESEAATFTALNPVPVLAFISPTEVEINTEVTLTVSGTGFVNTSEVMFDGQPLETAFVNGTELTALVINTMVSDAGTYPVTVVTPAPGGGESEAATFTALNPAPVLASISPTEVEIDTEVTLTLNGEDFVETSQVMFDGQPLETTYIDGNTLQAELGPMAEDGEYAVTVVNPAPGGGESEAATFTVLDIGIVITSAQESVYPPRRLETGMPRNITLTGKNFISSTLFYVNGEQVGRYVKSSTSASIWLSFPSPGTYSITASNDGVTFSEPYYIEVYNPVPQIWYAKPGPIIHKDDLPVQLRVYGQVFLTNSTVLLDGNPVEFTYQKYWELNVTLPADTPMGTHTLQIVNPAPGGGSSNIKKVHLCQMPSITSIEPNNMLISDSPVEVIFNGTGFDETSIIKAYYQVGSYWYDGNLSPSDIYSDSEGEFSYMKVMLPTQITSNLGEKLFRVYNPWCGNSDYSSITVSSLPPRIISVTPQEIDVSTYEETEIIVAGEYFINDALKAYIIDSSGTEMRVNINRISNSQVTVSLLPWWCLEYNTYGWCTKINVASYNLTAGNYTLRINSSYGSDEVPITLTQPLELDLAITYPSGGSSIDGDKTLVAGTIVSDTADLSKVDITVNGIRAYVYGNEWAANDVTLVSGTNIINAVAEAEVYSGTVDEQITVNATGVPKPITLVTSARSGLAPLKAYFFVASPIANSLTGYSIDFEGDGTVDYTGTTFDDVSHIYPSEGIYYPRVTVTDSVGNTYTDQLAVAVLPLEAIDKHLKGIWDGMKRALAEGNIEGALTFIHSTRLEAYSYNFNLLSPVMNEVLQGLTDIHFVKAYRGLMEYEMLRVEDGQEYSYYVEFVRDIDGHWRLSFF